MVMLGCCSTRVRRFRDRDAIGGTETSYMLYITESCKIWVLAVLQQPSSNSI